MMVSRVFERYECTQLPDLARCTKGRMQLVDKAMGAPTQATQSGCAPACVVLCGFAIFVSVRV